MQMKKLIRRIDERSEGIVQVFERIIANVGIPKQTEYKQKKSVHMYERV